LVSERRCTAKSKRTGKPCTRWAIKGGTVCIMHGGKAPQVLAKAQERLAVDAAVKAFGLGLAKDPERVLAEIASIAFAQAGDVFNDEGQLLPVKAMPPHVQAAVASFEPVRGNVDQGDGQYDRVVKIRLVDKPKMLEILAKHHGLMEERSKLEAEVVFRWKGTGQ
jgi:hypothetical protein